MITKLISANWGELTLQTEYPKDWKDLILPRSQLIASENDADGNCYIIQQFDTVLFTIRYYCFCANSKDVLKILTDAPSPTFRMGVSHSHRVASPGNGQQVFHEYHYNCFYEPGNYLEYPISPFEKYIFLDILLKPEYRLYLQYLFPATEAFFEKVSTSVPARLACQNLIAQAEILRWQTQLQEWCYDKNKIMNDANFIANKLIEAGIQSLNSLKEQKGITLSQREINKIYLASEIIGDTDTNFSLEELSAKVGLSPHRLDAGFKEIYGHRLQKHRIEEKMILALRLLDCKDSSAEKVAMILGYNNTKQFVTEFTRRFGFAPLQQRERSL